jgi:uncharacterized protein YycO
MQEAIRHHDSLYIPKEELFDSGKAGITWEEFENLPRRALTHEEVAGLKVAVEHRDRVVEHGVTLGDYFGNPTGTNEFEYSSVLWGDILVVHDGYVAWGFWRHTGIYNPDMTFDPILESDANGVHYSPEYKFKHYDIQAGLMPKPGYGYVAFNALQNAKTHLGKPYSYDFNNKWRTDKFYCSSLVWRGYYDAGWDIDSDGGDFVSPGDIYWFPDLWVSQWAD